MLVLSRKEEQSIYIGDDIKVSILRVHGNRVRLGISAPDSVRIIRAELDQWGDYVFENEQSAQRDLVGQEASL